MKIISKKMWGNILLITMAGILLTTTIAYAANGLQLLVTENGKISLSVDGLGVLGAGSGIIQVEKPDGATVRSAFMAATQTDFSGSFPADGAVQIDGQDVHWDSTQNVDWNIGHNVWADVTTLVKPKLDVAPAGRVDFAINELIDLEGEILAVIFDDPNQTTDNTVFLLFGAANPAGDSFTIYTDPLNTSDSSLKIEMALGISFGYLAGNQFSLVDINNTRLTSSAGDYEDGEPANGALLTVGGLDDSIDNPADPNSNTESDDELYSLLPFIADGDTSIIIDTINPSDDDNIFFSSYFLTTTASEEPLEPNEPEEPVALPETGFSKGSITPLIAQPIEKAYSATGLELEIPTLAQSISIIGVPKSGDSWDVSWLGGRAGYLYGSAYPTWNGNTVLTAHVWDANNNPGPFANIKDLQYGDLFYIHSFGQTYTYEVRESQLVWATQLNKVFQTEDYDWVTLMTCETFNPVSNNYIFRRVVRAVLLTVN